MKANAYFYAESGGIPNSRFPLIAYEGAIDATIADPEAAFEQLFGSHRWGHCWRNGIFDFHHYHSTAHEVLGIARGSAEVMFGGATGETLALQAGDAVLIPAGVGHMRESASPDLMVIGAYPLGQRPDLVMDGALEPEFARARIEAVPFPEADPIEGRGALQRLWRR